MNLRLLFLAFLITFSHSAHAVPAPRESLRERAPKPCFLFSFGKGPDGMADVRAEFRLGHLQEQQPYVDETKTTGDPGGLKWQPTDQKPRVEEIARAEGRKIVKFTYEHQKPQPGLDFVMLAIETSKGSEWYAPFFAAQPDSLGEGFTGHMVSGKAVRFGYLASLWISGTGAFRTHCLFEFTGKHPKMVGTFGSGGVRRNHYDSDEAYEKALKIYDREEDFLNGEVLTEKPAK